MANFINELFGGGKKKQETSPYANGVPMPATPKAENVSGQAEEAARAKRRRKTKTIYTDPLGASGQANIARKQLLGQ